MSVGAGETEISLADQRCLCSICDSMAQRGHAICLLFMAFLIRLFIQEKSGLTCC